MRWFRRVTAPVGPDREPGTGPDDSPTALAAALADLDRYTNRHAGRLPAAAVVKARWITDTLREILDAAQTRPLEIHAMLVVSNTARDYLPTTLRAYLALAEDGLDLRPSGRTPTELLLEQLDTLQESASRTLGAARSEDADALATQGSFLRTKFSRSDLDL